MIKFRISLIILVAVFAFSKSSLAADDRGNIAIRADSPDAYIVVEGDTLWDIAGVFLEEPWLWPEIWQVNPQIENPDLIYPGDTIVLNYVDGEPRIGLQRGSMGDTPRAGPDDLTLVRLSPEIRREVLLSPVPAIDLTSISSYLSLNRIVGVGELEDAPVLLQASSGRRFSREGDIVFAFGPWPAGQSSFDIVRPAEEITDPENGRTIALEAFLVGQASIQSLDGEQASLLIDDASMEVRPGDYFLPREDYSFPSRYFPASPEHEVDARVVAIESGKMVGGPTNSIVINAGAQSQLEVGHLLILQNTEQRVENTTLSSNPLRPGPRDNRYLTFPGETYGRILIYKVFENHSFALVLSSSQPVRVNDRALANP